MADLSYTQMYTRLNTWLRDGDDFTFSQVEKNEALGLAIDDPLVYVNDRDTSLSVTDNVTFSYQLPSGWTNVNNIAIDVYGDGSDKNIDRSAWWVTNGVLYFQRNYVISFPVGHSIILYGRHKLSNFDIIPNFLQEYVLCMAAANTIAYLRAGKTNRFLRNDVTMGEMLSSGQVYQARAAQLKRSLHSRTSERI